MKHAWFSYGKERRSKHFLLLEIGIAKVRLYAVNAVHTPLNVSLVAEESVSPGDIAALVDAAKRVLDANSAIRDLAIVMNSPAIHHHLITLPSVNSTEREKIVRLEMKRFASSGETSGVVSFWPAGRIKDNGLIKEYVLGAEMPRTLIEAFISAAQEKKINLIGFTSHPQMAAHLLKECRLASVSNVAFVEVNENEGIITLFHSNIWNMERQFLLGSNAIPDAEKPATLDMDKLKLEVGRALQYFKQQIRNENISQIFLYGVTTQADPIKSLLESSFRIPVSLMTVDAKRFATRDLAQLFSISHTAALHSNFEKYIDFLPAGWRRKKQLKLGKITVAAAAATLYIMMAGMSYFFKQEANQIDKREKASVQMRRIPTKPSPTVQNIRNDRIFALATEQSADWIRRRHHILSGFARKLAGAMPTEMRITSLEATEKDNTWLVKIEAEICSSNGSRSQELFLRFQDRMQTPSGLNKLSWSEIQLADSLPADFEEDNSGYKPRNTLTFSMHGAIAINPKTQG
jgi:hypothetical protein